MPGPAFFWSELKSGDFRNLDPEATIAILPVAATEQHGPHLPVMTDVAIAEGMIALLKLRLPSELSVLVLPIQAVGKSNEHVLSPGTLSLSAETLQHVLVEIGEGVYRAGLRKLILANSHGGNASVLTTVARELRVRFGMLVVATHWRSFGLPDGMYEAVEARHGIHAGDIETSLMLSFREELVSLDRAKNFVSAAIAMDKEFSRLSPIGSHAFGWIAQDLNVEGALGDASKASAAKGKATAECQIEGFIALLRDMTAFPLKRLYAAHADPVR
ncbi:MAG TPA: creatininase family protein [Xanthobacteraceae bacterium]|nr:creatininase family protein [Xanthobacteraceae bacterium]